MNFLSKYANVLLQTEKYMADIQAALAEIKRGAEEILIEDELVEKLKSGKKLKIKAGFNF